jgi:hypothetical protein
LNDNVDSAPAATPLVAVSGEAAWYLLPYPNRVGAFLLLTTIVLHLLHASCKQG